MILTPKAGKGRPARKNIALFQDILSFSGHM
jgi:hypothetical protein